MLQAINCIFNRVSKFQYTYIEMKNILLVWRRILIKFFPLPLLSGFCKHIFSSFFFIADDRSTAHNGEKSSGKRESSSLFLRLDLERNRKIGADFWSINIFSLLFPDRRRNHSRSSKIANAIYPCVSLNSHERLYSFGVEWLHSKIIILIRWKSSCFIVQEII